MQKTFLKRIRFLSIFVVLIFCGIVARLFMLQIADHAVYAERASRQQGASRPESVARGGIFVSKKEDLISIATTQEGWLLAVDPRKITNAEELYKKLSETITLTLSKEEFMRRASKKNDPHEVIEHHIQASARRSIESLGLSGIEFLPERWRTYPAGDFAAHAVGFVNADGAGQYGLERAYNRDLDEAQPREFSFFAAEEPTGGPEGASLVLTLDAGVQAKAEEVIRNVQKTFNAQSAGVLVIRPKTGAIVVMAAAPSYDPNTYAKVKNISVFSNPLVENLFEMGSVVKPLTMAAAVDAGTVSEESSYVDVGKREIDGYTIENFDGKARGKVPVQEILSQSLNIGAVHLMEALGKDRFRDYMRAFGLDQKTGIDLPNEATGNLKNLESTRLVEFATASFGQGISMTAVEFARALSSIANGGFLVNPYLVEEMRAPDGSVVFKHTPSQSRVLKEETSKTLTRMLVEVVDKKLAGGKGKIPGYSVAAKTGTAQIALKEGRGYSDEFMHTFFGYGPAFSPEFFVFMYLERPQGIRYASESLTQPFRDIMQFLFSYFEVMPDRPQELSADSS